MHLASVRIRNYRLLVDAELEVDSATTLIVGRNNTAKTSLFSFIKGILEGGSFGFDDIRFGSVRVFAIALTNTFAASCPLTTSAHRWSRLWRSFASTIPRKARRMG